MGQPDHARHLADVDEIEDLAVRYCFAFLQFDAQLLLSLWEVGRPPVPAPDLDSHWARERAAKFAELGAVARQSGRGGIMLHVTNHLIRFVDDQSAHGRVQALAQMDRDGVFVEQSIVYHDLYVKVDAGWVFRARKHVLWFGRTQEPNPLDQQPTAWPSNQIGVGDLLQRDDGFDARW